MAVMTHKAITADHEALMIEAHKAGRAYWRNNQPADRANVEQVARSCGWSDPELLAAWMAGYFGERARMALQIKPECIAPHDSEITRMLHRTLEERHARGGRHGHYGMIDRNCDQCIQDGS
jgi:hypothetical protein